MPTISLTTFIDFVSKSGTPKMTVVRNAKAQEGNYRPSTDFWRYLRERIIEYHDFIDGALVLVSDRNRLNNFPSAIAQYKKFLGNKSLTWFAPSRIDWSNGNLDIRINPELGLEWGSNKHIIKLYFKKEPLSKTRADLVTTLLQNTLPHDPTIYDYCLLDIQANKLYSSNGAPPNLMPLLVGEALSFGNIWPSL